MAEEKWNVVAPKGKKQPKDVQRETVEKKQKKQKPKEKKKDVAIVAEREQSEPTPVTQIVVKTVADYEFTLDLRQTGYQLKGCVNHGNECYHLAVVQALLACPAFLNFAKTIPKGKIPPVTAAVKKVLLDNFKASPGTPADVSPILTTMGTIFKPARTKEQADASEYLITLLSRIDEEMRSIITPHNDEKNEEEGWETIGKDSKSRGVEHTTGNRGVTPISEIFEGTISSRLASRGSKPSVTIQPFIVLPVDIIDAKLTTVVDFIKDWASPQSVDLPSGQGTKQMSLANLPPVLILCLKLWFPDSQQKAVKKFQLTETLTIPSTATTYPSKAGYSLSAVVYHRGGDVTKGHYTAIVKKGDKWALLDDTRVAQVPGPSAAQGDPYLLFYCRK